MKAKKNWMTTLASTLLLTATALTTACGIGDDGDSYTTGPYDMETAPYTGSEGGEGNTPAGIVTASEWNDLRNWPFWSQLMTSDEFSEKSHYWEFFTNNRVAVSVSDAEGRAQVGVSVELLRRGTTVWQTKTDNRGEASLWVGLHQQQEEVDSAALEVRVGKQLMAGHPSVCRWDTLAQPVVNRYVAASAPVVQPRADIAFIVDATGSMDDEIRFLKSDLVDIIGRAGQINPELKLRTAALFYRDEGDDYLTRHTDFTEALDQTAQFVAQQQADGGGDYPEAVHTALEQMLQQLSWDPEARSRIAFMLLDAPAHHEADVISSLHRSVERCARMGIRLIPVAASGVDKNTEFMLRFFAVTTGGTYVFLTNDSGVGGDHIQASVGPYKVEQLNNLLVRLIDEFTTLQPVAD